MIFAGQNWDIVNGLIRREIASRYRGSMFGVLWSLLTPLLMLAVYTFMFGYVLKVRWNVPDVASVGQSTAAFALMLFSGLMAFHFFAEILSAAPTMVLNNRNYVKKIVFPIHILPVVSAGAALFHAMISLIVLLIFAWFVFGGISWTAVLVPVVFAPLVVLTLGLAWFLAAAGVYFRDIGQIVPPLLTAMMFLSPIFVPRTALPEWLQPYLSLNPLSIPVEAFRDVTLFGVMPDWTALAYYSLVALPVAWLGERFFQLTRRGFADVL